MKANIEIEKAIRTVIPELDLGGMISRESPVTVNLLVAKVTLRSPHKMDLVCGVIAVLILAVAVVLALSGGAAASGLPYPNS